MKQKYHFKTLPMLMASLTVGENFVNLKNDFVTEKPKFADPFITNFEANIEKILKEYFGISSKEQLKEATRLVKELQTKAVDDLGMIKTQIERGFRKNKERCDVLLEKCGYTEYWKKASKNNQTMVIGQVTKFANNIDETLQAEMVKNGVNESRITAILDYSKQLKDANVSQETLKGTSKINTEKAVTQFNEVYDQSIDICLEAQRLFKRDNVKKSLFVFSKLVKIQGITSSSKQDNNENDASAA
jgi:hypothetical protein